MFRNISDTDTEQIVALLLLLNSLGVFIITLIFVRESLIMTYPLALLVPFVAYYSITKSRIAIGIGFSLAGLSILIPPIIGLDFGLNEVVFYLLGSLLFISGLVLIIYSYNTIQISNNMSEFQKGVIAWVLSISFLLYIELYFHFYVKYAKALGEIIILSVFGVAVLLLLVYGEYVQ